MDEAVFKIGRSQWQFDVFRLVFLLLLCVVGLIATGLFLFNLFLVSAGKASVVDFVLMLFSSLIVLLLSLFIPKEAWAHFDHPLQADSGKVVFRPFPSKLFDVPSRLIDSSLVTLTWNDIEKMRFFMMPVFSAGESGMICYPAVEFNVRGGKHYFVFKRELLDISSGNRYENEFVSFCERVGQGKKIVNELG